MDLEKIIKGCREEDRASQRRLFDYFSPKMMAICLRYTNGNVHDAEDIFQEAFIRVFDKIGLYNFKGSFEGWLRRVFINVAIKKYHQHKKESVVYNGYSHAEENPVPPEIFEQLSEMELIELINNLPDGYRLVFNMYVIDGYSHREIGEKLNIAESTSRSQLTKAKKILKDSLERQSDITIAGKKTIAERS